MTAMRQKTDSVFMSRCSLGSTGLRAVAIMLACLFAAAWMSTPASAMPIRALTAAVHNPAWMELMIPVQRKKARTSQFARGGANANGDPAGPPPKEMPKR